MIIAGLGAMGSAAAWRLASRGIRVLGLDQFAPPHSFGSSHGESRIIREAYFEDPIYVPLVQRAYDLWHELEGAAGVNLLRQTGGLMIGAPDSDLVMGALRSAQQHRLEYQQMSARDVHARFPALTPESEMVAVWEPRAGALYPEACVKAALDVACQRGAELHFDEPVVAWEEDGDSVRVVTPRQEYRTRRLVIAAGAWAASLLAKADVPFWIERQVFHWFIGVGETDALRPDRCPVHLWQFDGGRFFYGFPDFGNGVKVAFHHEGAATTADSVNRQVDSDEIASIRAALNRFVPQASGALRTSTVCVYTNTPDGHFWIDRHPDHRGVIVASPCSGHGFKFAPTIGEIIADLVEDKPSRFDLRLFRWRTNPATA